MICKYIRTSIKTNSVGVGFRAGHRLGEVFVKFAFYLITNAKTHKRIKYKNPISCKVFFISFSP